MAEVSATRRKTTLKETARRGLWDWGGCHYSEAMGCESAFRDKGEPAKQIEAVGFRVAVDPPGK